MIKRVINLRIRIRVRNVDANKQAGVQTRKATVNKLGTSTSRLMPVLSLQVKINGRKVRKRQNRRANHRDRTQRS